MLINKMKIPPSRLMNSLKISSNWKVAHCWKQKYLLCFPLVMCQLLFSWNLILPEQKFFVKSQKEPRWNLEYQQFWFMHFYVLLVHYNRIIWETGFLLMLSPLNNKILPKKRKSNSRHKWWYLSVWSTTQKWKLVKTSLNDNYDYLFFPCKMIITFSSSSSNSEMWEYKVKFIIYAEYPTIRGWINKIRDIYVVKDCRITWRLDLSLCISWHV